MLLRLLHWCCDRRRWRFDWRYLRGHTPWESDSTPIEVLKGIEDLRVGRALDLGCGTGTHALTLARRGWDVTGIDFAARAIRRARERARAAGLDVCFVRAHVAELGFLAPGYGLALDIGCLYTLDPRLRSHYVAGLRQLLAPGGRLLLYSWLPRPGRRADAGLTPASVGELLREGFARERLLLVEEKSRAAAWYQYRRSP